MQRYVCIHCHFYQPPRENPWLEAVELQDSASPYHDWNERVTAECYAAERRRADSRRTAESRRSSTITPHQLQLWSHAAFLDGTERAQAYERVLEADRESQAVFSGHGSALAQAYNHMILPLADTSRQATQILWGIRDFQRRFGRDPEGMWLPETAVDVESLELLSEAGIKFTVLAPHQARRMRNRLWEDWQSVEGAGSIRRVLTSATFLLDVRSACSSTTDPSRMPSPSRTC